MSDRLTKIVVSLFAIWFESELATPHYPQYLTYDFDFSLFSMTSVDRCTLDLSHRRKSTPPANMATL
jgi:hypothetical protein